MSYDPKKPRILVALGGRSSEREVSIKTGIAVSLALEKKGYPTAVLDTASGKLMQTPEAQDLEKDPNKLPEVANLPLIDIKRHFQLVFIAMHGRFGEDGGIQSLLEEIEMPYTGSSPSSSAIAMNKKYTLVQLNANGIKVPHFQSMKSLNEKLDLQFPVVVKPVGEGSSVGVSICENPADFEFAKKTAFSFGDEIIVEKYIKGKELTVGILELKKDNPEALPVIEIIPKGKFFDYKAKYDGTTQEICPARISPEHAKKAQEIALKTYNALDCHQFARVDMILTQEGEIYTFDINTIPGLTDQSLMPKAAKARGLSFEDLVETIVKDAIENS
ncbi:MAG: D-alanine--D-alanine ligase [bacterium]